MVARKWRPIPNCPGRYVLVKPEPTIPPAQLAQIENVSIEYQVKAARDVVLVLPLEGGGLITYQHADGTFLHTLNDEAGFKRKLAQLGIGLNEM
jgi:hypothetical protein